MNLFESELHAVDGDMSAVFVACEFHLDTTQVMRGVLRRSEGRGAMSAPRWGAAATAGRGGGADGGGMEGGGKAGGGT